MKSALPLLLTFLFAGPAVAQTVTYEIHTQTSWVTDPSIPYGDGTGHSGTTDQVYFTLYGTKGTTSPIPLAPRAKGLNDGGGYDTFTVQAGRHGVPDVGRVLRLGLSLEAGTDDWHAQTLTVVRKENGVDKDHSSFPFFSWLKPGQVENVWVGELQGKHPTTMGETIVLREDWIVFNNLRGTVDRTMKETVSMTLDEGMWSSKTKDKKQAAEITVGLGTSVMGVDVSTELKASTETAVGESSGGDLNFSKSVTKEFEETIPAGTLLLKNVRWEIQGEKRTMGPLVQWIPKPSTLTTAYTEPIECVPNPNGTKSLVAKVDSTPIDSTLMAIIVQKSGGQLVIPNVQPVVDPQDFVQGLEGSRWSYDWQGTEFQFTFGAGSIDRFTNGYWPGVTWQSRGQNRVLLVNKPRADQRDLPPGAAYVDKTMFLNFDSSDSFTGTDWDGVTPISGRRLNR